MLLMLEQWAVGVGAEGFVGVGAEGLSVIERRVLLVLLQLAVLRLVLWQFAVLQSAVWQLAVLQLALWQLEDGAVAVVWLLLELSGLDLLLELLFWSGWRRSPAMGQCWCWNC